MNKSNLDFDPFEKQLVIVLVCAKCSKLITLEENIISVLQLPLCLPLFFVFSSEVLNSGIKSCLDGAVFEDAVCEECLVYVFGVFTFSFVTVLMRVLSLKLFYLLLLPQGCPKKSFKHNLRHIVQYMCDCV